MSLGFSLISLALGRGVVVVGVGGVGRGKGRLGMSHCYSAGSQRLNGYISTQPDPVDTTRV